MIQITNRRKVSTSGADFYPTPRWATEALLEYQYFDGTVLEPCCGDGAMSKVLEAHGCDVTSSDLYDRGYGQTGVDALTIIDRYDNYITNPPFNIAGDILEHAMKITNFQICLLLRTAFLESQNRYNKFFKNNPPETVLVFSERLSMYPAGQKGAKGSGTTSYSWFVWNNFKYKTNTMSTQIKWIAPGLKKKYAEI